MRRPTPGGGGIGRPELLVGGGATGGAAGAWAPAAVPALRGRGCRTLDGGRCCGRGAGRQARVRDDAGGSHHPVRCGRGLGHRFELDLGGRRERDIGSRGGDRGGDRLDFGRGDGLDDRRGWGLRGLRGPDGLLRRCRLDDGLFDDGLAAQALGVGETPHAVGKRVVNARRVALDADLQAFAQIEYDLVLDAELSRELVHPDLLRGQSRSRLLPSSLFLGL